MPFPSIVGERSHNFRSLGLSSLVSVPCQLINTTYRFPEHLESGLLEVISPPESFYPDMNNLRQTLGDPIERVRWVTLKGGEQYSMYLG